MKDIVPELQKSILADFQSQVEEDFKIQRILSGEDEKATFADVSKLSARLGEYAADSLKRNLTDETLPDGVLYWNIAKRTIVPLMQEVQKIALDMAETVQTREDKKAGIGIKPIRPEFNEERIEAVMNKVVFLSKMPEVPLG
jgi:hypothetical protein